VVIELVVDADWLADELRRTKHGKTKNWTYEFVQFAKCERS
jgi:hypothetical protein